MTYCRGCVLPSTRPNLQIGPDGVCDACARHRQRPRVDWAAREEAFRAVVARARESGQGYDCVIPVSGGKDSTWQVVTCLEHGLKPLAVTWKTPGRTAIGADNLANLVRLGVDHIDYQIDPNVERRFMYATLAEAGSPAIPMHLAIFNIPLTVAVRFGIPLVVWGENSALEYGGAVDAAGPEGGAGETGFWLDARWVARYGVTQGTTAGDWISETLTRRDLTPYFGPTERELDRAGVLAVFLGYYVPWDPQGTLEVARAHGFRSRAEGPKTGLYDYADIDDDFISVHHFLKWYKFGFTRSFDNLSLEIRNGRMTRDEAIAWLGQRGDETPHEDIVALCRFLRIDVGHFFEVIERFRNRDIWVRRQGRWEIDGFLIPDWPWA